MPVYSWLFPSIRSELLPTTLCLIGLQISLQIKFAGRARRNARQYPRVGGKREWNMSQLIDPHATGDRYGRYLGELHRALTDYMAAQHHLGLAIDDEFAKTDLVPINDRARGRIEA